MDELPSDFRIVDGGYEIRHPKKGWVNCTNFTMTLTGEVNHPQDTMYTAIITRDDGVKSVGHFALGDIYRGKDFATALNRSTADGGTICLLQNHDLARLVKTKIKVLKTSMQVYRRELVTCAGIQEASNIMVINPQQVIHLDTGDLGNLEDTTYVCIGKRQPHMERYVQDLVSEDSLGEFFDYANHVLGEKTFGVALLAWCAMYLLNFYGWTMQNLRHFNLPVLFGEPMVGKSLIASCAAWMNGCPRTAIVSRSTLSYVTSMVTGSTMPFVWDDPSTPAEVSQLAIDLGNAAVRGKMSSDTLLPRTGCLVTANFDMSGMLKYFSRIVVLYVQDNGKKKVAGEGMILEEKARQASAAFPRVMKTLHGLSLQDVHHEYHQLKRHLSTDIRILEGIAVNFHVTRQILNLAGRYQYLPYVKSYIQETMIPYYRNHLNIPILIQPTSDIKTAIEVEKVCVDNAVFVKRGTVLAVDYNLVKDKAVLQKAGVECNKATKLRGRTKKMVHLPTTHLDEETVNAISERIRPVQRLQSPPRVMPPRAPHSPVLSPPRAPRPQPPVLSPPRAPDSPQSTPVQSPPRAPHTPQPPVLSPPRAPDSPQSPPRASCSAQPPVLSPPTAPDSPQPHVQSPPTAPGSPQPHVQSPPTAPDSPQPHVQAPPTAPDSPQPHVQSAPRAPQSSQHPIQSPPTSPMSQQSGKQPSTPRAAQFPTTTHKKASTSFMQSLVKSRGVKRKQPDLKVLMPLPLQSVTDPDDNIPCGKCKKKGHSGRLWVQCEKCDTWYHSSCQGLSSRAVQSSSFRNQPWKCC